MSALTSSPSPAASPRASFHVKSPRTPFLPTQRSSAAAAIRSPPHRYPANSPKRTPNVPAAAAAAATPQQPKQNLVRPDPSVAGVVSYIDAGTQYSPEGYPPTAGRSVGPTLKELPGASTGTRKRKEIEPPDSSPEQMSAPPTSSSGHTHVPRPTEPSLRVNPNDAVGNVAPSGSSSAPPPEPELQEARSTHGHSVSPNRPRSEADTSKVMPLKYETCNPKELGVLISNMLMELIRINDRIPLRDGRLTRFHSRAPPGISVSDYLQRLIQHATLSPPILLSMVYYIDRLCTLYPAFTINSLTVHRFLITAATVAAKGLSDSFWTNPTYAQIGGIPVSELATLELELLQRVQWKIVPKPEVLEEYYSSLVDRTDGYTLEESSTPMSGTSSVEGSEADSKSSDSKKPGEDEDEKMTGDLT